MPIQYPNFNFPIQRALMPTPDYSGIVNFIPQALQAYKQTGEAMLSPYEQRHTKMMNEEKLKKQAFENALMEQFGAQEKEANIAHKMALTNYYQQGGFGNMGGAGGRALTNMGKALREREYIAGQYGEDSPQVQSYDAYINKISAQAGGGDPAAVRTRQINAALSTPVRMYFDENVQMPIKYQGPLGAVNMEKDILDYKTTKNPKIKEELEESLSNAAVASRTVPEYVLEQLAATQTQSTEAAQRHQKEAITQNWGIGYEKAIRTIPKEIADIANKKHSKVLSDVNRIKKQANQERKLLTKRPEILGAVPEKHREPEGADEGYRTKPDQQMKVVRDPITGQEKIISIEEFVRGGGVLK